MNNEKGFSLIELIVVVALIAIVAAIAMWGSESVRSHRLTAASKQLYGDLQKIRVDAMTKSTPNRGSRGFGIRFNSNTQYTIFEFQDDPANTGVVSGTNNNFRDDGGAEEGAVTQVTLPSGVTVTVGDVTTPPTGDANIRIYDKKGMMRTNIWGSATGITYVLSLTGVSQVRCVTISTVRIREGVWDTTTNDCQIQ